MRLANKQGIGNRPTVRVSPDGQAVITVSSDRSRPINAVIRAARRGEYHEWVPMRMARVTRENVLL